MQLRSWYDFLWNLAVCSLVPNFTEHSSWGCPVAAGYSRAWLPVGLRCWGQLLCGTAVPQGGSQGKTMMANLRASGVQTGEETNSSSCDRKFSGKPVFSQLWMFLSGLSQLWAFKWLTALGEHMALWEMECCELDPCRVSFLSYFSLLGVVLQDCSGLDGMGDRVARGVSTGSQQKIWIGPRAACAVLQ